MRRYYKKVNQFSFFDPALKSFIISILFGATAITFILLMQVFERLGISGSLGETIISVFDYGSVISVLASISLFIACLLFAIPNRTASRIRLAVKKRLFNSNYGNPLHFKEGNALPKITCRESFGMYILKIRATSTSIAALECISGVISSALDKGRLRKYAVTRAQSDEAMNHVKFYIKDVMKNKKLTFKSAEDMKQYSPTKLIIQAGDSIDISSVGSCLCVGRTRSGKSYGITSFLLQLLLQGRDIYGSEIIIVDAKAATFHGIPRTILPDEDGSMDKVIDVMKSYDALRRKRQQIINQRSKEAGTDVKWYEIDMHPCYLVLEEFVSLRTTQISQKPLKDDPEHCVAAFDSMLKTIVTMGASAGCFVIISIAQASVGEGGLPSMISEAMGTKILFRPSKEEAKLVWKSENLDALVTRNFEQGEAWFTAQDGIHNVPTFVRFPKLDFRVNDELERLMRAYYSK